MNVIAVCESAGIVVNPDNTISCSTGWMLPAEPLYGALEVFNLSSGDLAILIPATMAYFVSAFAGKQVYKSIFNAGHGHSD